MRLRPLQFAPALMAVIYGSLVTLGHALHLLPGLDHFSDTAAVCCCCCDHHGCDEPADGPRPSEEQHDCPICDFLGLSQDRPADLEPPEPGGPISLAPCGHVPSIAYEPTRLVLARGPPTAATPIL